MITSHAEELPHVILARRRIRMAMTRTPTCIWPGCGATLESHHAEPVCSCHVPADYRLPHDRRAASTVLHLLAAAYPGAVDLCRILRCSNDEVRVVVRRLRRQGWPIMGARRGFVLELPVRPPVFDPDRDRRYR